MGETGHIDTGGQARRRLALSRRRHPFEFVGGSDIIKEMFQAGELKTLLAEKGVLAA